MSLKPGQLTFSAERLRALWREPNLKGMSIYTALPLVNHEGIHGVPRAEVARKFCLKLYTATEDPDTHVEQLDKTFSTTYRPRIWRQFDEDAVIERATSLLAQLPITSPTILEALPFSKSPLDLYTIPRTGVKLEINSDLIWDKLLVVNFVDSVVLRIALQVAHSQLAHPQLRPVLHSTLNATLEILRMSLQVAAEQRSTEQRWIVVCAFLWTSWQRILMLALGANMKSQLNDFNGSSTGLDSLLTVNVIPEIFKYRIQVMQGELRNTPYLCAWAHQMLLYDSASISTDLRHFHEVYRTCFGRRPAVCNSGRQCEGQSSLKCGRFEQSTVTNQSMHTSECHGNCQRLFWSKESFMSISGPKAIDIEATDETGLRYIEATEKTLAISHVWSHGQGGRPDMEGPEGTGFNACLHHRYVKIALSFGCVSYWMDTPCIPSEAKLRQECISNIIPIFTRSQFILICDRDLMAVDLMRKDIDACEQILATLLVSDWNMRAWTLLEAMRGRKTLHILCLNDIVIGLHNVLRTVHERGRMDLAVLFLTRAYLLPPTDITSMELFEGQGPFADEDDKRTAQGFIDLDEALILLSNRHATRDDDDLLIWSMLVGEMNVQNATELWKQHIGKRIPTGALVSSTQRLTTPGLQWAPSRPAVSRRKTSCESNDRFFPAYSGYESVNGMITAEGLRALWLTFKFEIPMAEADPQSEFCHRMEEIIETYLIGFKIGIILQICPAKGPRSIPIRYRGSTEHVLVICGSQDRIHWQWRGLYEWSRTLELPKFVLEEILLS